MSHYSFRGLQLNETIAHSGTGFIRTSRVADEHSHAGLYFIDLTEIPPGHSIGLHRHGMEDEEVYVVVAGTGQMTLNDERFVVHAGDVIVNRPGGTHGLLNTGHDVLRLVVLDLRAQEPRE